MSRGGKRPGAGRPKGALNRSTRAILEAAKASGEMPIEYMLRVMRDEKVYGLRRDKMALAVAPYLYPRLSIVAESDDQDEETFEVASPAPQIEPAKEEGQ
jgi:hypothetical protein